MGSGRIRRKYWTSLLFILSFLFLTIVYNRTHQSGSINAPAKYASSSTPSTAKIILDCIENPTYERCSGDISSKIKETVIQLERLDNVTLIHKNKKVDDKKELREEEENENESLKKFDESGDIKALALRREVHFMESRHPTPNGYVEVLKNEVEGVTHPTFDTQAKYFKEYPPSYTPEQLKKRAQNLTENKELQSFLREQEKNREQVANVCKSYDVIKRSIKGYINSIGYKNIFIDRVSSLTYCPVFKAASTTWSVNLMKLRGAWTFNNTDHLQEKLSTEFVKSPNLSAAWMGQGTTKFMVVRHPLHRLVSCYRDKFEDASKVYYYEKYGQFAVKRFRKKPEGMSVSEINSMLYAVYEHLSMRNHSSLRQNLYADPIGPTFEEFFQFILALKRTDEHWRPYFLHCSVCEVEYDFYLRFENLKADSRNFMEYLNQSSAVTTGWHNPTDEGITDSEIVCRYVHQLTTNTLINFTKRYTIDYALFGYNVDDYKHCTKDYNV